MNVIWSDTLDPVGSQSALRIEIVLRDPPTGATIMTMINMQAIELPNGPCLVRTAGPSGPSGPVHFRHDTSSALVKAKALADALRIKRRTPSNG